MILGHLAAAGFALIVVWLALRCVGFERLY